MESNLYSEKQLVDVILAFSEMFKNTKWIENPDSVLATFTKAAVTAIMPQLTLGYQLSQYTHKLEEELRVVDSIENIAQALCNSTIVKLMTEGSNPSKIKDGIFNSGVMNLLDLPNGVD